MVGEEFISSTLDTSIVDIADLSVLTRSVARNGGTKGVAVGGEREGLVINSSRATVCGRDSRKAAR